MFTLSKSNAPEAFTTASRRLNQIRGSVAWSVVPVGARSLLRRTEVLTESDDVGPTLSKTLDQCGRPPRCRFLRLAACRPIKIGATSMRPAESQQVHYAISLQRASNFSPIHPGHTYQRQFLRSFLRTLGIVCWSNHLAAAQASKRVGATLIKSRSVSRENLVSLPESTITRYSDGLAQCLDLCLLLALPCSFTFRQPLSFEWPHMRAGKFASY